MSHSSVQILSLDPPCLLVQGNGDVILINAPSNVGRTLSSNPFLPSCKELKHVYLDSLYTERINGISGLIFLSRNAGVSEFKVSAGTPNLFHYMQYFRSFVRIRTMQMEANAITKRLTHHYKRLSVDIIPFAEDVEQEVLETKEYEKPRKPASVLAGDTNTVYVGGFDESVTEDDLREWFGKYGSISEIDLPLRPTPEYKCRQFCFITYQDRESVRKLYDDWFFWKRERGIHIEEDTHLQVSLYFGDTWKLSPSLNDEKLSEIPKLTNTRSVCSYIIKGNEKRGKFDVEKAKMLGVPKGRNYSLLTSGETIITPEGRVVTPEEVVGESLRGGVVLVVNVPNIVFLEKVIADECWRPYFEENEEFIVYHLVPPNILYTEKYQAFISRFSGAAKHIIVNEECERFSPIQESYKLQLLLQEMRKEVYPLPYDEYKPPKSGALTALSHSCIRDAQLFEKYSIEPGDIKFINHISKLDIEPLRKEYRQQVEEYWQNHERETVSPDPRDEMISKFSDKEGEVCILGTASANPSRFRGVTGLFLNFFEDGCILLDCGEGSLAQLNRIYSSSEVEKHLMNLKAIFISHLHADHHCDLINILATRAQIAKRNNCEPEPLVLIANSIMRQILSDAQKASYDGNYNYVFIDGSRFYEPEYEENVHRLKRALRLSNADIVQVVHSRSAYALIIEKIRKDCDESYKIVFSGDCRPSEELVEKGKNALLLVHEATFDTELGDQAIKKKHTTVGEAIDISQSMNAYCTILMHFSQRYPCAPPLLPKNAKRIYTSFDLLKLRLNNLDQLENLSCLFEHFFKDQIEESLERQAEFLETHLDKPVNHSENLTCRHFSIGRCFSPECKFKHDPEAPYTICRLDPCQFGDECWFKHSPKTNSDKNDILKDEAQESQSQELQSVKSA